MCEQPWLVINRIQFTIMIYVVICCIYNTGSNNQEQRPGRPNPWNRNLNSNSQAFGRRVISCKSNVNNLDLKYLKEKGPTEVLHRLNEGMAQLKFFLRSQGEQHNSDEFVVDLTCTLAIACRAPPDENTNRILAALKGSLFLSLKIPDLLDRVQESMILNDDDSRRKLIECLIIVFTKYLTHLPSSYADLPYVQLKLALDQSSIERKEELQIELRALKQARDDIIRGEREKRDKRYINRAGEKPPNDFRDLPICPTNEEITTQERPFLRENITKGGYKNAEHYLDVQFRLLREDFLEPLREGIQEIVQNVPKQQRKQLIKNYHKVRIVGKEFTWLGITHHLQIDVTRLDTSRWPHSKRLMFGSFLCLSTDNFKTMFFATVANREPEELKEGRIDIRFIEEQDVRGIESRDGVYQMVESPAYFESYRHVLKGLKELDEKTLPFQKYLVECSGEVDPPEYLRRDRTGGEPVCYDLSKALDVQDVSSATAVPVLVPEAWPPVNTLPLNNSQLDALRTAITTEFSVIQGPPGTGKTYVGAKIVRCLLENRATWERQRSSPMLMVCYTNHALDQFLEKVLEFLPKEEIIRVGGRSRSQILEGCNLKNFTSVYRLPAKRREIETKIRQNKEQMEKWKEILVKAEEKLLEFDDIEELLHSAHTDQLYNAIFPPHVASECRTPGNTFKLWLCDNKLIGSYNQITKVETEYQTERHSDGSILEKNDSNGGSYDAIAFLAPQNVGENNTNNPLTSETRDPCTAVDSSNKAAKTHIISNDNSKQQELKRHSHDTALPGTFSVDQGSGSIGNRAFSNNIDKELVWTPVEKEVSQSDVGSIKKPEGPQVKRDQNDEKVVEVGWADEETIEIEREADLIQYRRWIQGDEELLQVISEKKDVLSSEQHKEEGVSEDTNDGWETVTYRKRNAKLFPWQKTKGENSQEKKLNAHQANNVEIDNKTVNPKSSRKKKKKKKKSKVRITGDISSLKEVLVKEIMMSTEDALHVDNIWNLSQSDRLRLYLFWIENYRERYRVEIHKGEQEHQQLCEELEVVRFEEEERVISRATVVGMTTSGAARYHSVLQRIAPAIVVIEEAAEVMEAHIITSLSHNTKHTILIGDHKQLRPKATVYELAQKYNLGVSLFERMVINNMDCKRLSIQHRMRPEIAALTKRIYDHEIIDHETVCHFEDISGVNHNLFFINHCLPETLIEGLQSYSNRHEAEFLAAFCNYLLLQGYDGSQITVLTMYTGQLLLLQERMPKRTFKGVKVCAVDNFQGEENDIILLSLVRSNSEGRIGFLGESNRICVALSRARKGLYCIGNFSLLKINSKLWKDILDDIEAKNAIGDSLQLVCKKHKNVTNVSKAREFNPLGGCNMPCAVRLPCGHACAKQCHTSSHKKGECLKICLNRCPNEHPCRFMCHFPVDCPMCFHKMPKTVPKCGHEQQIPCCVHPEKFSCRAKCERILPCEHKCGNECGQQCTILCQEMCMKSLPCGHEKRLQCHKDPMVHNHCNNHCTKLLSCGHPCSKKCREKCQCNSLVDVQLPCEHMTQVLCRVKDHPIQCFAKCKRKLDCGHDCPGICHEDCTLKQCKVDVVKILPCGHQQIAPCYQDPETAFCYAPCPRELDCGHKCSSVCGRLCQEVHCEELCQKRCERGHACQRRCHFGSSCGDCMIEVNMKIPACGHNIKNPCYLDTATLKCKHPCERTRVCGHPCIEICGRNCEARLCKFRVPRTLSCNHVVTLECHKNTENHDCKEIVQKELPCKHTINLPCYKNPGDCTCRKQVDVKLPCGHMKSLRCSTVTSGLTGIQCTVKVLRTLPCNHEATLPCHAETEGYCCLKKMEITLTCGHTKFATCCTIQDELRDGVCGTKVTRRLPCGHEKEMRCSNKPDKVFCDAPCEKVLHCGHQCPNKCSDDCTSFQCAVPVERELSCGYHKVTCHCSEDVSQYICVNKCKRNLICGHRCPGRCSDDCSQFKCQKMVEITLTCGHTKFVTCCSIQDELRGGVCGTKVTRRLPCGHEKEMHCSNEPDEVFCDAPCKKVLHCGHQCPNKCGDDCTSFQCAVPVERKLSCGYHKVACRCSEDVSQYICVNKCKRNLICGHRCPGRCSDDCSQFKCQKIVLTNLNCPGNHKEDIPCFQSKTRTCQAPCQLRKKCKHKCKGVCGKPCSYYPCDVVVDKTLSCGHKIKVPCDYSVDDEQCSVECGAKLPCGHQCAAACGDCQPRGSHEMCRHPCGRLLVCLHRCKATCSEPCPPCGRECNRRCPHAKCTKRCSQPCEPCKKPCTWSCPHYQCNNPCGEECDRPPCDAPCPKKLACRHPCIGLCGEICPTLCAICHAKKLSSMLGGGRDKRTESTKYMQLLDCGHILTVEEMDMWMMRQLGSDVQLIQCPRCSKAITFSFRYGNLIKRTMMNNESVKKEIHHLANEAIHFCEGLLGDVSLLRDNLRMMDFPRDVLTALQKQAKVQRLPRHPHSEVVDRIHMRNIPFLFAIKNHLFIMHLVKKVQLRLQKVTKDQVCSREQLKIKQHTSTINESLEEILQYLMKPQLDLRTLDQVHVHTRKFSLFARILQAQYEASKHQRRLSNIGEKRLKMAHDEFNLFLQGHDDALQLDWLERIVTLLSKEVGLVSLPPEESKDFANFPGFNKGVWKLCEHREVYFTRSIVRNGEDVSVVSKSCGRCVDKGESD